MRCINFVIIIKIKADGQPKVRVLDCEISCGRTGVAELMSIRERRGT